MATIQQVASQARKTFMAINSPAFLENLEKLKLLVNTVTASDINLVIPKRFIEGGEQSFGAPVSHINIYESSQFTMGVFILKQGSRLPLHDHPGMAGVIKVLCGSVGIHSYTDIEDNEVVGTVLGKVNSLLVIKTSAEKNEVERAKLKMKGGPIPCRPAPDHLLTKDSESHCLTPASENYHTILNASPSPAAFLDILGPPYQPEKGRDCSYFRECDPDEISKNATINAHENDFNRVRWLKRISPPRDFYCDSQPYRGPPITL